MKNFPDFSHNITKPSGPNFNIVEYENLLKHKPDFFWQKLAEKRALKLFHLASRSVPAYKDFLIKNKIDSKKIKSIFDFKIIPPTDKKNYIEKYPLAARALNGSLDDIKIIASSSGTSGQPNYWPRSLYQEQEASLTHKLLFKSLYNINKLKTLIIIGFPMGVYVSGVATLLPSWLVAQKYNTSIITVGNSKVEALKAIKALAKNFEQTLLIGHPFFIKDVIETGTQEGINWSSQKVKMMFCSEGFNENWREYLIKNSGLKSASAYNTYGCSEMLLIAYETPLSVKFRQFLNINPGVSKNFLNSVEVPNIFQYNPSLRFIEEVDNELLFTSFSGIPLIRFNLHDTGKIIPYSEVLETPGLNLDAKIKRSSWKIPFVSVSGRSDYAVIFYAVNIYPQHIHSALSHEKVLKKITGKFSMSKGYYKNMDEFLEIHIELKEGVSSDKKFSSQIQKMIIEKLKKINLEYNFIWHNLHKDIKPKIRLWQFAHEKFFKQGLKPRYIV